MLRRANQRRTAVPGGFVRLFKRTGRYARTLHLHSFQIAMRIPQGLMTEPDDYLRPHLQVGTVTFVGLGRFVLLAGLAIEETEDLMVEALERASSACPLLAGIQWPGGLRAVSDAEFESLYQLFRGNTADIGAEDVADRPRMVIVEEQRKRALEQRRQQRADATSNEPPKAD